MEIFHARTRNLLITRQQLYPWYKRLGNILHSHKYNVNFPRHKLWVCFLLINWFEYHIHVKGEVSLPVINKMAVSVMTAPPGKSGIRLKREIWTWAGMRTRIAQVVERRARNSEVRIFLLRSYNLTNVLIILILLMICVLLWIGV